MRGIEVPPERAPSMIDEYPILSVVAALSEGRTVMRGVKELRVKESDRIDAMARGLEACGVRVEEDEDTLIVHGMGPGGVPGGATAPPISTTGSPCPSSASGWRRRRPCRSTTRGPS
jgi:3-phosphoshikimate 1-carboxyvinyltransferase